METSKKVTCYKAELDRLLHYWEREDDDLSDAEVNWQYCAYNKYCAVFRGSQWLHEKLEAARLKRTENSATSLS
jgi:hypothetical protein